MDVFADYAHYYDLLYRDKDYAGEVHYVAELVRRHHPTAHTMLELGCGTGRHAILLQKQGYEVTGIDVSGEMIARAQARLCSLPTDAAAALRFLKGDIRDTRLERQFDVVISLFHVFSYQTTNQELSAAFATAQAHLKPGGILVFDCWYGPGVLHQRPETRIKRLEDEQIEVTRMAEPEMHPNQNRVDVHYQVLIRDKASGQYSEVRETHRMRYLFRPEIELQASLAGLEPLAFSEWMTAKEPGFDSWSACVVARRSQP